MVKADESAAGAIYLSNLQDCRPGDALSVEPVQRKWRLIEYETDACSGMMLAAGEETAALEVSYSLEVRGWHRIYIGLFYDQTGESGIQVRLSDDPTWSAMLLGPEGDHMIPPARRGIYELYWKEANLDGQHIHFSQVLVQSGVEDVPALVLPC